MPPSSESGAAKKLELVSYRGRKASEFLRLSAEYSVVAATIKKDGYATEVT